LNKFWPHRPSPKGFSIEKLASKYREKISRKNRLSLITSSDIESRKDFIKATNPSPSIRIHWANRDFSEYRKVA
tara:strand:+ start:164 stop:385 length:222 start_codon:yes stop_codon:yes gene_type:complete